MCLLVSQGSHTRQAPQAISTVYHGRREASGSDHAKSKGAALPSLCAEHPSLLQPSSMPPLGLDRDGWLVSHTHPVEGKSTAPAFLASRVSLGRHKPAWSRECITLLQPELIERHPVRKKTDLGRNGYFDK